MTVGFGSNQVGTQYANGFFQVHTVTGDAPNPLWQFDGSVDLLTRSARR